MTTFKLNDHVIIPNAYYSGTIYTITKIHDNGRVDIVDEFSRGYYGILTRLLEKVCFNVKKQNWSN